MDGFMIAQLYTPKEVAKLLKVNYRKVLELISMGELEAYRVGGVFRISAGEINRYLSKNKVKSYWRARTKPTKRS